LSSGTVHWKCCIQANTHVLSTQEGYVGGIFCEFVKAFYCVNNEILRAILHFYGIQGTAAVCIITYLTKSQHTFIQYNSEFLFRLVTSEKWGASRVNSKALINFPKHIWHSCKYKILTRTHNIHHVIITHKCFDEFCN